MQRLARSGELARRDGAAPLGVEVGEKQYEVVPVRQQRRQLRHRQPEAAEESLVADRRRPTPVPPEQEAAHRREQHRRRAQHAPRLLLPHIDGQLARRPPVGRLVRSQQLIALSEDGGRDELVAPLRHAQPRQLLRVEGHEPQPSERVLRRRSLLLGGGAGRRRGGARRGVERQRTQGGVGEARAGRAEQCVRALVERLARVV
mmetsp:Transcript_7848/g.23036  ORF Transcript_7848/g.23036 Transcript_7848/m.23036 type:complete len:203 (+) Transcript_7848:577-1185(+)